MDEIIHQDRISLQAGQSIRYRHGTTQSPTGRRLSISRDIPGDTASGIIQTLRVSGRQVARSSNRNNALESERRRLLANFKSIISNRLRLGPRNQYGQEQKKQLPYLIQYILNTWLQSPLSSISIIRDNEISERITSILDSLPTVCRFARNQYFFHVNMDRSLLNRMIAELQTRIRTNGLPGSNLLTLTNQYIVITQNQSQDRYF